jgi:hypothetical protein
MTFHEYIQTRRITDTPRGDFIADAKGDSKLIEAKSWDQLWTHLYTRGACPEAIKAARSVWRGYEKKVK